MIDAKGSCVGSDEIITIGGVLVSAFGGTWFAYRLGQSAQRESERRRFRIAALDEIHRMFTDTEEFGQRLPRDFTAPDELNDRLSKLVKRTGDAQLAELEARLYKAADQVRIANEDPSRTIKDSVAHGEMNLAVERFYASERLFLERSEELLRIEYEK